MPKLAMIISVVFASFLLNGCASEQIYATGQNMQRSQCMKNPDTQEQSRCFKSAETSYNTYKLEVESAGK
jgi:PBP1b-binding outer membrane lipoprotein LpoB